MDQWHFASSWLYGIVLFAGLQSIIPVGVCEYW